MRKIADILLIKAALLVIAQFLITYNFVSFGEDTITLALAAPLNEVAVEETGMPLNKNVTPIQGFYEEILPVEPKNDFTPAPDPIAERKARREELAGLAAELQAMRN